jgi:hypothetical protein
MLALFSVTGWGTLVHSGAAAARDPTSRHWDSARLRPVLRQRAETRASWAAVFTLLCPVFGVSSSILVLGEPLRAGIAVGGAIVLGGLWLVQRRPARQVPAVVAPTPACHEAHSRA